MDNDNDDDDDDVAAAADAGIEPVGGTVGVERSFTVETFSAGRGQLLVTVTNPHGTEEPVSITHSLSLYVYIDYMSRES